MIDGRLLVPAGAAWLACAGVLAVTGQTEESAVRHFAALLVLAVSGAVVVGVFVRLGALLIRGTPIRHGLILVTLLGFGAGAFSAGLHVQAITAAPLAQWTDDESLVSVIGVAGEEPIASTHQTGWGSVTSARMKLATESIVVRATGSRLEVNVPMLVQFSGEEIPSDLRAGAHVLLTGRLAQPFSLNDYAATLQRAELVAVVREPGVIDQVASAMRAGLRTSLSEVPTDPASLVAGLAVGDESRQSAALEESMQASGLAHLTAVSGGNVAIVLAAVLGIAALLRLPLSARVVCALAALAFFVVLVRPQPSVLRASVMGAVVLAGLLLGGRRSGPAVLSGAVITLMIISAPLALAWGFALSVMATAGLIVVGPWIAEALGRRAVFSWLPDGVRTALAITIAAQIGALPVLAAMGVGGGPVSIPANLLAMPAVPPVTILGLLAAVLSGPAPAVASAVAGVAGIPAGWIASVAHYSRDAHVGAWPLPPGWWGTALLFGLFVVVLIVFSSSSRRGLSLLTWWQRMPGGGRRVLLALVVSVGALWVLAPADRRTWPPPHWFVLACDVGQGDALVIRDGDAVLVVDVGPEPTLIDECLREAGVDAISSIIISHFHRDHVGGIDGALRGREVGQIVGSPLPEPEAEFANVDTVAKERGLTVGSLTAGAVVRIGEITVTSLWPRRIIRSGSEPNNASLVLEVEVAGLRILLTGDIEPEAQAAVMAAEGGFDIAKVPHHGSRNQHPRFANWAGARVALITVGADNEYGHPAPETLAAWQSSRVLRTDLHSDIAIVRTDEGWGTVTRVA